MTSKIKYDGFLKIVQIKDINKNGVSINREVMSRSTGVKSDDSVAALLYDETLKLYYLVSQYRAGCRDEDRYLMEVVAGTLEKNEDPLECIERESMEEVGFLISKVEELGSFYTSPGGTTERIYLYIGYGEKIEKGGGLESENEDIEILSFTEKELFELEIKDLKTQYLILILKARNYAFK